MNWRHLIEQSGTDYKYLIRKTPFNILQKQYFMLWFRQFRSSVTDFYSKITLLTFELITISPHLLKCLLIIKKRRKKFDLDSALTHTFPPYSNKSLTFNILYLKKIKRH